MTPKSTTKSCVQLFLSVLSAVPLPALLKWQKLNISREGLQQTETSVSPLFQFSGNCWDEPFLESLEKEAMEHGIRTCLDSNSEN